MTPEIVEASLADVPQIVGLHMQVFGSARHLGVLFGARYLLRMYTAAVHDVNFVILKASDHGQIVGFASARLEGYHSVGISCIDLRAATTFVRNLGRVLTPGMLRRLIGRDLSERKLRKLRKKPYAQAYITCVSESNRGSGIGSLLRVRLYQECELRGARFLYTGILMDNAPMLAISRRDGFHEILKDNIGSVVYLEKQLNDSIPST